MDEIDPRLRSAFAAQLDRRRETLGTGARHVGWKLGMGDRERIGDGPVVGHLTSATQLALGEVYTGETATLHADAEVALLFGADGAIVGFAPALELVDLAHPPEDAEAVIEANIFHRAFALGPSHDELAAGLEVRLLVDGEDVASAPAPTDLTERVAAAAKLLAAMGEPLRAGDVMITGSVVQAPVAAGDKVVADFGPLGQAGVSLAASGNSGGDDR